jgi:hypothetical protein
LSIADLGYARDSVSLYGSFRMSLRSGIFHHFFPGPDNSVLILQVVYFFKQTLPVALIAASLYLCYLHRPLRPFNIQAWQKWLTHPPAIQDRFQVVFQASFLLLVTFVWSGQVSRAYVIYLIPLLILVMSQIKKRYFLSPLIFVYGGFSVLFFYDLLLPSMNTMVFGTIKFTTLSLCVLLYYTGMVLWSTTKSNTDQ